MIKRLLASVREYKAPSLLTPLFMILEVAMEIAIPYVMATLIDKGIDAGNMQVILRIGGILVVLCLFSLCFGFLGGRFAAIASEGFASNLRHDMYYNTQKFSFSNIDKFSTASIVTRLTTDVTNIQNSYQMCIRIAVRAPATLLLALIMAFKVNGRLATIFLLIVPVLAIGMGLIINYAHPLFERVFRTYDELNQVVQEDLHGIRVVKAFVREEHQDGLFYAVSKKIFNDFSKATRAIALTGPLMQFCAYGGMLLISWVGARLIVANSLTTGELMNMINYAMQILMSLMMLSMIFVMLVSSRASMERADELLQEKSDLENCAQPVTDKPDGGIVFEHVDFSYAKDENKLCLRDIDFSIKPGEVVGIIGGTGAGKTSLVQLIPRLYDVTRGSVKVGGRDVRDYDLDALREAVSVVLQKNTLFSGTVADNLRWGDPNASEEDMRNACRIAAADEFLDKMPEGYNSRVEQGGTNFSGGQRQRLCIARALLKKPSVLIFDDSTSAVDTATDARIRKGLREAMPDTTKIIIAQRVNSVEDADKIIVMDNGRIDGMGTHEELLKYNAIYREVYESQVKGGDFDE